jgi:lipoprotein-anchoring transpeptidase ErfK/SrfK
MVGRSKAIAGERLRKATTRLVAALIFSICASSWAAGGKKANLAYHLEPPRPLSRFAPNQILLLEKLNRADRAHLGRLNSVIVPNRWDLGLLAYSPMPLIVPWLSDQKKALVVELAGQVFGAYEYGLLVRWGPVSSGGSTHTTPSGHYYLNWNARVRRSSENYDWIMPWYFNFSSVQGLGMHQYDLPGRPASHGCVRLLEVDAKWVFHWGEGWTLGAGGPQDIIQNGTPVLIIGSYDFTKRQPWLKPAWWAAGVTLPDSSETQGMQ